MPSALFIFLESALNLGGFELPLQCISGTYSVDILGYNGYVLSCCLRLSHILTVLAIYLSAETFLDA